MSNNTSIATTHECAADLSEASQPLVVPIRSVESMRPRETMRGLPRFVQPYLTWVTGAPLAGETPLIHWTPARVAFCGILQMAAGIAMGAFALAWFTVWSIPLLVLSSLITVGGMRRLDVVIVHHAVHKKVTRSARGDRIIGELITTVLWRLPYDRNRKEHLYHHAHPCSKNDGDTRYLLSTGMRPGMSAAEYGLYALKTLFSPRHHVNFFMCRIKSNFALDLPRYRLLMSIAYVAATMGFLAATGLWVEWLLLWLLPVSFVFQNVTFLYTNSEHRWWINDNVNRLTRAQRDVQNFARMCGEPTPDVAGQGLARYAAAWTTWWLRVVLVHTPCRLFVLVGDTGVHDLHHVRPSCDWPNSTYERNADVTGGCERYSEVWGSLLDHLYAAGAVKK